MEIRHILAPTDFSDPSLQAIAYAFELAQTFGAKISLLHVIELPDLAMEVYPPLEELEQDARRALARLLPEAEGVHVEVTHLEGKDQPWPFWKQRHSRIASAR